MATAEETLVTLDITQDDVDHGEREACDKCPIARAGQRAVPTAAKVSVGERYIHFFFDEDTDWTVRELPLRATEFVRTFDDEGEGNPFSFPVSLPTRLLTPRGAN